MPLVLHVALSQRGLELFVGKGEARGDVVVLSDTEVAPMGFAIPEREAD